VLVVVALVVVALVGAVTWVVIADDDASTADPRAAKVAVAGLATAGQTAPDFEAATLDGKTVRLSDYAGRPIVVNFWASYCHPCRQEFPMFRNALERHDDDFVLLGVDYKDITSDARRFVRQQRATWPIVVDPTNVVARAYGVRAVPQTFFIGPDGKISERYYAEIPADLFEQELAKIR